jgi:hypothetical protein
MDQNEKTENPTKITGSAKKENLDKILQAWKIMSFDILSLKKSDKTNFKHF